MIRRATSEDVPAIRDLWNEVIRETTITFTSTPKSEAEIAAIVEDQPMFVALVDGTCRGFATYGPFRGGDGYAHTKEHAIYLGPAARGQGFGRALMDVLEADAKAEGVHSLIGGISAENAGGLAFHGALGFVEVGHVPEAGRKFGRLIDLVLMQKHL
ncbi:GNAT family N-acetyltransferase [Hasllibacter sp. MH4015]|uniref:GNAT family N-acetyltransferase n=1 Tax=Hasllibacter sp. MH4015 TaxID=2854029 RepID=UPI001CD3EC17|nr:GNAT family N-acetyltransferase [Hasllibacter sp. MH4015]